MRNLLQGWLCLFLQLGPSGRQPPLGTGTELGVEPLSLPGSLDHQLCFRNPFPPMPEIGLGQTGDFQVFTL